MWRLAIIWQMSRDHIANLVADGDIEVSFDVRRRAASRYSVLIPRRSIVAFLERRKMEAKR